MRHIILTLFMVFGLYTMVSAQDSIDELKSMKADKEAQLAALQGDIDALAKQIDEFPGWKIGGVGIVGFDLNSNSNWFAINNPHSTADGIGVSASAFANLDREKYFWRNLLTANVKQVRTILDNTVSDPESTRTKAITDALDISSLFGYKLSEKLALSAEGKYISTVLNFNNPGKLLISAGVTWTPINNLVVIVHPLAYEFNFPSDAFVSAPGAKIGASYAAEIIPGVAWSSNLSAFIPYSDGTGTLKQFPFKADSPANNPEPDSSADPLQSLDVPYSTGDLTNWTWINSFSTNLFKGIGVGFNIGLRQDVQIANQWNYQYNKPTGDNPLQVYYNLGLSYTL